MLATVDIGQASVYCMHAFHSFRHAGKRGYACRCICIRTIYEHRVSYRMQNNTTPRDEVPILLYVCWLGAMQRNPMQADNAMYQLFQKEAVLVLMMNASEGVVNKFTDSSCRNLIQSRIQFCIERCMHACVGPTLFICLI
jgi:hypothetical protein